MNNKETLKKCFKFLSKHGWFMDDPESSGNHYALWKRDVIDIDIAKDFSEIAFIDGKGVYKRIDYDFDLLEKEIIKVLNKFKLI